MADIFDEVDEEIRQERAARLWRQYGSWLIAAALAVVIAVGGYRYWQYYQANQRSAAAAEYASALAGLGGEKADQEAAVKALEVIAVGKGTYSILAQLRAAAAKLQNDDTAGALALYNAIAESLTSPKELRDLAVLLAVSADIDTGDRADLMARLAPLAAAGSPWRPMAMEMQAALALRAGDIIQARTLVTKLSDDATTPTHMRARATELLRAFPKK